MGRRHGKAMAMEKMHCPGDSEAITAALSPILFGCAPAPSQLQPEAASFRGDCVISISCCSSKCDNTAKRNAVLHGNASSCVRSTGTSLQDAARQRLGVVTVSPKAQVTIQLSDIICMTSLPLHTSPPNGGTITGNCKPVTAPTKPLRTRTVTF